MAKRVSAGREELYERITDALRAYQRSVDLMDETACVIMGINRTDGRCVDLLHNNGPMTAGRLATEAGLTTGGVTAVIDRLEKGGWVRRTADPSDRRRVMVEVSEKAVEAAIAIYGPLGAAREKLDAYSDDEIGTMIGFLEIAREITDQQSSRLREGR